MKRFLKIHLVLSLLISLFATNVFADDPCARDESCGKTAAKCERSCEGSTSSGSCIEACRRDYEECVGGLTGKGDIPDCDYPKVACQVGDDEYVCKHKDNC